MKPEKKSASRILIATAVTIVHPGTIADLARRDQAATGIVVRLGARGANPIVQNRDQQDEQFARKSIRCSSFFILFTSSFLGYGGVKPVRSSHLHTAPSTR